MSRKPIPGPAPKAAPQKDDGTGRTGRLVAIVIAVTMVLWLLGQWIGGQLGLDPRYAFLFDFAAIAALVWSLVVTARLWRRQNPSGR